MLLGMRSEIGVTNHVIQKKLKACFFGHFLFLFLFIAELLNGQILQDAGSLNMVRKCIEHTYNMELREARAILKSIDLDYPVHPVPCLLKGMIIYWENYPLLGTSSSRSLYEKEMRKCIELCEKNENLENDPEYLLADLCARGMLLLFYADNDLSKEVIPLAASTYQYIRRSFFFTSVYSDFFFFTGLYNYYREAYPEAYPIYKPLALLFPKGDSVKGLKELRSCARNSIMLKAESSSFLSGIFMSFEDNYKEATAYLKSLYVLYPGNIQYRAGYIKNLLLEKRYDEAESLIDSSSPIISNPYFKVQLLVFNGILQEKKYHNLNLARDYYTIGSSEIMNFGNYGNEYASYCWFGLSRISEANSDKKTQKIARNKAMDLSDFANINFDE